MSLALQSAAVGAGAAAAVLLIDRAIYRFTKWRRRRRLERAMRSAFPRTPLDGPHRRHR